MHSTPNWSNGVRPLTNYDTGRSDSGAQPERVVATWTEQSFTAHDRADIRASRLIEAEVEAGRLNAYGILAQFINSMKT
jgi:hypothetical protein